MYTYCKLPKKLYLKKKTQSFAQKPGAQAFRTRLRTSLAHKATHKAKHAGAQHPLAPTHKPSAQ